MKKMIAVVFFVILLCTGCSNDVSLTAEQNDLVAEYTAGVLVKYSFNNQWKYTKLRKEQGDTAMNTGVAEAKEAVDTGDGNNVSENSPIVKQETENDTTPVDNSITDPLELVAQRLNIKETTISYKQFLVVDSYPEGDLVLRVPAGKGNKIIAVEFTVSNPTDSPILCNTADQKPDIKLQVNDQTDVTAKQTMLKNDLLNLKNVTINPKESISTVAMFFVPQDKADNISSLTLSVDKDGKSALTKKLL